MVITPTMLWCTLNINCLVNYATMAVLSVWHHHNYRQIQCPFLGLFWIYGVGLVILWPLVYSQVVSMKISSEISILSFLTLFSGWTLFACSFWQCLLQFVISLGIVIKKDNNVIMISYLCNAQLILSVRQEILSFVFVFTLVKFRKLIIMMINC